jgi:hypothetical protein
MNWKFSLTFIVLLTIAACSVIVTLDTETRAVRWQQRVESVESIKELHTQVAVAQQYTDSLFEATKMLANENGLLCERDAKAMRYVTALEAANLRLKTALKESVESLQTQIEANNELHAEIEMLYYRISMLELALDFMNPPTNELGPGEAEAEPFTDPYDDDLFSYRRWRVRRIFQWSPFANFVLRRAWS